MNNVLIGHLCASLMRVIHGHVSSNLKHLRARPQGWAQLRTQHRAIWAAIREHLADDAARAAAEHIGFVRQSMEHHALEEDRRSSAMRRKSEMP